MMLTKKIEGSTAIKQVRYETRTNELTVHMTDGTVHTYGGVGQKVYEDLINASSVGGYFNRHIRDSYSLVG